MSDSRLRACDDLNCPNADYPHAHTVATPVPGGAGWRVLEPDELPIVGQLVLIARRHFRSFEAVVVEVDPFDEEAFILVTYKGQELRTWYPRDAVQVAR